MPDDFKRWVDIDIPVGSIWQYVYDKPMRNNDISFYHNLTLRRKARFTHFQIRKTVI